MSVFHNRVQVLTAEAALAALPASCRVFKLEDAWLVVARTGMMVITADDIDLPAAAHRAAALAESTRSQLFDTLQFVPFVDAVVLTSSLDYPIDLPALIIPFDMLEFAVTNSSPTIDEATFEQLTELRLPLLDQSPHH